MLFKTDWYPGKKTTASRKAADRTVVAKIVAHGNEEVLEHERLAKKNGTKYIGEIARKSNGKVDLRAEIAKRPDALWFRAKAIEADMENDNGDYFSREELVKSYKSFEGVPIFTNHENDKIEAAKGKVVLAEWDEKEKAVYCTAFVDREAYPNICRAIEEGYVTDVSMGTQVDYSVCSICDKKAYTADQYCDHVKTMKGRTVNGRPVFERNFGLKFIELSIVTDGACESCTIREVIDPEDFGEPLDKAAATIKRLVSTGDMSKEAGADEINKLNEAQELLAEVSKSMLDQRQYLDLEFLNKITEVLADLQHATDDLVDQGYGSVGAEGTAGAGQEMEIPPMTEPQAGQNPEGPEPVMEGQAPGGVGSVTEPAMASRHDAVTKLSQTIEDLRELTQKFSDEAPYSRESGTPLGDRNVDTNKIRPDTVEKLASVWENPSVKQFSTEVSSGDFRVVVGGEEVIGLRGGKKIASLKIADLDRDIREGIETAPRDYGAHMLDALRKQFNAAIAQKVPSDSAEQQQQTIESQLESQRTPLHPRVNEVREEITEKQLSQDKWGENYDQHHRDANDESRWDMITEKQLNQDKNVADQFERQGTEREDVQEEQLKGNKWKGNTNPRGHVGAEGVTDQTEEITQKQLDEQRGGDSAPRDIITEKQLADQGAPWGRRIASREDAKLAVAAVHKAMARTVKAMGATPEEVAKIAGKATGNVKALASTSDSIEKLTSGTESRQKILHRASFHGHDYSASDEQVREYLLGSMADEGFGGEVGTQVLAAVSRHANVADKVAQQIQALAEEANVIEESPEDFISDVLSGENEEEDIHVELPLSDIKARKDTEDFAKEAFKVASRIAETHGVKATKSLSVKTDDDTVTVALSGTKMSEEETSKAKKAMIEARKEARKKLVEAQFGGEGGGMPAAPGGEPFGGGGTTMPAGPGAAGDPMAAGMPPVGALTGTEEGEDAGEDPEIEGEALPPGTFCYNCKSDDVDVSGGEWKCNDCGAEGTVSLRIEMTKAPGIIEDRGPGEENDPGEEEEGGIGDMEGGPGMEMPAVGLAASFKVTPQMVKKANNKPIGSVCPSCRSDKVKLATRQGTSRGECEECGNKYKVDTFVDAKDQKTIWARVEWKDRAVEKIAKADALKKTEASRKSKRLSEALRFTRQASKFEQGDLKTKAEIIDDLQKKGLL